MEREVDFIEALMSILADARQTKTLRHRINDLENQRDYWKAETKRFKEMTKLLGVRLELISEYVETDDGYFTFPDGALFMVGQRLKEHKTKLKENKQRQQEGLDNKAEM